MRASVLSLFCLLFLLFFVSFQKALAVENPLAVPNNKFGVHILFQSELADAAKLVNGNGGKWGYVTIPIQTGDRDLIKWQTFMDETESLHIIPIIRLATEGDYFNTQVWRKPNFFDIADFANFLDSLQWPTKNRYIIVFNEPNRGDEWEGSPNPEEYAQILGFAASVFKFKNENFFIISAGLDNAATTIPSVSMNSYTFLSEMQKTIPDIFTKIDGMSSHSYPNPAFSRPPTDIDRVSIATFRFEKEFAKKNGKDLPIFITETGWSKAKVSERLIADYFVQAYQNVWSDESVVAVTPFILKAFAGPFADFSLVKADGLPTQAYTNLQEIPKIKGEPVLIPKVLGSTQPQLHLERKRFSQTPLQRKASELVSSFETFKLLAKWLLKVN